MTPEPEDGPSQETMPARWWEPAAVYRLWDASGNLLYIGSAYDPEERCKSHRKKPWWPDVACRTEEWHPNRGYAYVEEMKAIATERARHNAMGSPDYETPQTEAIKQRKALASMRQRLLSAASATQIDISAAACEAGYTPEAARRLGALAEIEFLERTALFAASVKRRRKRLELHGW